MQARKVLLIQIGLILFALVGSGISLTLPSGGYDIYWFYLPIIYAVMVFLCPEHIRLALKNVGMCVFAIVIFVRYVVVPLLFSLSEGSDGYILRKPSDGSANTAFFLLAGELVFSLLLVKLLHKKMYLRPAEAIASTREVECLTHYTVLLSVVFVATSMLLYKPEILLRYNFFIIYDAIDRIVYDWPLSGLFLVVVDFLLFVPALILLSYLKRKYDKSNSIHYFVASLLIVLPFMLVFKGVSRFSVLVPTIAWMVVLLRLYPQYKKFSMALVGAVAVSVFISITLYKHYGQTQAEVGVASFNVDEAAFLGNAYFSGLYNMAYAVEVGDNLSFSDSYYRLYNDVFANLALLSGLADKATTSSADFNYRIYGIEGKVDQIIPMSGQGYIYFGPVFSFLVLLISVYLLMFVDSALARANKIEYIFAYSFMSIYFAMSMMLSFNSIYPLMFNVVGPLLVLFYFNRRTFFYKRTGI